MLCRMQHRGSIALALNTYALVSDSLHHSSPPLGTHTRHHTPQLLIGLQLSVSPAADILLLVLDPCATALTSQ